MFLYIYNRFYILQYIVHMILHMTIPWGMNIDLPARRYWKLVVVAVQSS